MPSKFNYHMPLRFSEKDRYLLEYIREEAVQNERTMQAKVRMMCRDYLRRKLGEEEDGEDED